MGSVLEDVAKKGFRVISNAGGVAPRACGSALTALATRQGIDLKIAVVEGDDVMPLIPELRAAGITEFQSGAPLPKQLISANAYLGAFPIATALDHGAQVVITARCVDSAVTLGPLIHEFGWKPEAYNLLAAGSLAGHLLECACQATARLHTAWEEVPDRPNIGYPLAQARADGRLSITKPPATR